MEKLKKLAIFAFVLVLVLSFANFLPDRALAYDGSLGGMRGLWVTSAFNLDWPSR